MSYCELVFKTDGGHLLKTAGKQGFNELVFDFFGWRRKKNEIGNADGRFGCITLFLADKVESFVGGHD